MNTPTPVDPATTLRPLQVGLLGAGGIGSAVVAAALEGRLPGLVIHAIAGSSRASASAEAAAVRVAARVVDPSELARLPLDVVLEAAGVDAVRTHLPQLWRAGLATVVMSIGALLDPEVEAAFQQARARGVPVHLPSGAIGGLDALRAITAGGSVERVTLTTTKAPASLRGAPYLRERGLSLPADRPLTIFEGSAREAVVGFPANVNVAIAVSLAGIGPDRTQVVVRSDPNAERTVHQLSVIGEVAELELRIATPPSASNPRSSRLAVASAIAALQQLAAAR